MSPYTLEDISYTYSRIKDTYVRYKDTIGFVTSLSESNLVELQIPKGDKVDYIRVDIRDVDVNPPQLGYINYGDSLNFVARLPQRGVYKQGLHPSSVTPILGRGLNEIPLCNLRDAIFGVMPSFSVAVHDAKTKGKESAWHRNWGVTLDLIIIYKGEDAVGEVKERKPDEFYCELYPEYEYLSDELEESYATSHT